jgi:nucleoid-associated protein YgaU
MNRAHPHQPRDSSPSDAVSIRPLPGRHARPTTADIVTGIAAAMVLLALVVGIPALLLVVSPIGWPPDIPGWSQITGAVTRPDDGQIFLAALAVVAWLAWACFTVSVLVEVAALARGAPTPRLPLLRVPQAGAAVLVAAAAVLVSGNAVLAGPTARLEPVATVLDVRPIAAQTATSPDAPRHSATYEVEPRHSAGGDAVPTPNKAVHDDHPSVAVQRGDTLWALAERHLGSGNRYREIAELNYGRAQPDGRTLTEAHWIYPGWMLLLPIDASGSAIRPSDPGENANHTVESGDTLWDIAERHLGNGQRHNEIFDLNVGIPQPGGGELTDPDLIRPGWVLRLPSTFGVAGWAVPRELTERRNSPERLGEKSPSTTPQSNQGTEHSAAHPAERPDPKPGSAIDHPNETDDVDDEAPLVDGLMLGLGVVAASGLIAELVVRRRRAQRHRRPGQRLPRSDGDVARTEQVLRTRNREVTLATVSSALRALASECRRQQRLLPDIHAIRVSDADVELLVGPNEHDTVPPFSHCGPRRWRLDRDPVDIDDEMPDPYPVLVTIGVDDDAVILVNLEAAGTLSIIGPAAETGEILHAIVAELGTSPLAASVFGGLVGFPSTLASIVDQSRFRILRSVAEARGWATARLRDVAGVLSAAGVRDITEARSRDVAADAWVPEVLVLGTQTAETPVATAAPHSGLCMILVGEAPPDDDRWVLRKSAAACWRIDALDLDVVPQRLGTPLLEQLRHLMDVKPHGNGDDEHGVENPPDDAERREPGGAADVRVIAASLPNFQGHGSHAPTGAPRVLVLGPVEVQGVGEVGESGRRRRGVELITYLALHPGGSQHQLDEAIWPGSRITKNTRNPLVSRTRQWLGRAPDGDPYLPLIREGGEYRLRPEVTCDWHDFVRLAKEGLTQARPGPNNLVRALELVRGRPFLGVDAEAYTWAESDTQDMISAIVDVAHALATVSLSKGDHRRARWAAARGLLVEPASEVLYRDAIRAAAAAGDTDEVGRLADGLRRQIELLDPDDGVSEETAALLASISTPIRASGSAH